MGCSPGKYCEAENDLRSANAQEVEGEDEAARDVSDTWCGKLKPRALSRSRLPKSDSEVSLSDRLLPRCCCSDNRSHSEEASQQASEIARENPESPLSKPAIVRQASALSKSPPPPRRRPKAKAKRRRRPRESASTDESTGRAESSATGSDQDRRGRRRGEEASGGLKFLSSTAAPGAMKLPRAIVKGEMSSDSKHKADEANFHCYSLQKAIEDWPAELPPPQPPPQEVEQSFEVEHTPVEPISGWLLKMKGLRRPAPLARASVDSCGRAFFWRPAFFELGQEYLTYGNSPSCTNRGAYTLAEIDGVAVRGQEIILHFVTRQRTGARKRARESLCLRASSSYEADQWGETIRLAAAARLRDKLPREWDVTAMLSEDTQENGMPSPSRVTKSGHVARLVAEVKLPPASVLAVQRLVDHTFICKRTRDRGDFEVPVRMEVVEVVRVQNSAAWVKYNKARGEIQAEGEQLVPAILTSTHEDRLVSSTLGSLDADCNEQWLFHGTSPEAIQGIANRDFRLDLAGSHRGTLYGKGLYLAECSSKADEYAYEDENGLCRMLLCRAVLGSILVDQSQRPPAAELTAKCKTGYNSLCGDRWAAVGTYREFVLYNQTQVYPAYIILYRRMGQAQLLQAIGQAAEQHDLRTAARLIAHAARLAETHPDHIVRYRISMLLAARTLLVVPALRECLHDDRRALRRTAAAALGKLGAHTSPAIGDASDLCKAVAGSCVPVLAEKLKDDSGDVRKACAVALQQFGVHAVPAVPALIEGLQDSFAGVREECARCLGQFGSSAVPALSALAHQLQDDSAGARQAAATALGSLCCASGPGLQANSTLAVAALADCLSDPATEVRQAVASALGKVGVVAAVPKALEGLTSCLEDESDGVRQSAATALGQLGPSAAAALPQLQTSLHDESVGVRGAAAAALGCFGVAAAQAVHALKHSLKDTETAVCVAAACSLGQIAGQPGCEMQAAAAVHALARCLKDTDVEIRIAAAGALGYFGSSVSPALPALTERIKDASPEVRKAASLALSLLGEHAAGALPALTELLNDPNEDARRKAASTIADINRKLSPEQELEIAAYHHRSPRQSGGFESDVSRGVEDIESDEDI